MQADPALQAQVLAWLESPRWSVRLGAAMALLHAPGGPFQDTLQRVLASLDDQRGLESYPARLEAASFLINRDPYSQGAVRACLEALDYGTQSWEYLPESGEVRRQAALILGGLEPLHYDEQVYTRLRQVLLADEDADVRDAAYNALVRLAGARGESDCS